MGDALSENRKRGANDGFQAIALKAIALQNILNLEELAAAQAIDFGLSRAVSAS
jgi:hypothetical protein